MGNLSNTADIDCKTRDMQGALGFSHAGNIVSLAVLLAEFINELTAVRLCKTSRIIW